MRKALVVPLMFRRPPAGGGSAAARLGGCGRRLGCREARHLAEVVIRSASDPRTTRGRDAQAGLPTRRGR